MTDHQKRLRQQREEWTSTLVQERDMFRAIVENTHTHLAYLDTQFNFVWVNSAYALGSGHSKGELIGRNHFELFPDAENQAIFERVRETGQTVEFNAKPFEYLDQPERGTTYWDWTLVPVKDEVGQVQGLVLSLLEVTERKQAEEAQLEVLRESRQRQAEISALLDGARAVLGYREFESAARSIFHSCKTLIGASAGYVALLAENGIDNQVLFLDSGGLPCTVDPTLPMPMRGLREEAYRTGKTVYDNDFSKSEWTEFIPNGHAKLDNVLFAPLVIKGIATGLLGLANKPGGFTEDDARIASAFGELVAIALLNSRTLEALQNSEERFRSVAQTAGEAIITIDSHGNITFWNKMATTMFGYTHDEAIRQPITLIMSEWLRAAHQKGIERVVSTGKSRLLGKVVEMVGLGKDGREFPIELSLSTWKNKDEIFFSGIIHDITQRKRTEEQIQSLARFPGENRNPVLRISEDGTILYANEASAPLLDVWASQVGQKLPDTWCQLVADAVSSNEGRTLEVACGERVFSLDLTPVLEAGYANLYGRDITEQKQAQELLKKQNQFITTVFESLAHPFYVIDADDYTIKMANPVTYTGERSEPTTCYALTHRRDTPCDGREHRCTIGEIKKTGKPTVTEHIHFDKDGNRKVYEVHGHPIFDDQGSVSQIIEYTLDITERRRTEDALSTLLEISHQVALTLELEPLLNLILLQLEAVVDYDDAVIFKLEKETLIALAYQGTTPQAEVLQLRFSLEHEHFVRRMIFDQEVIIIPNVHDDTPRARDFRNLTGGRFGTVCTRGCSWMGVPLTVKDQVIGILILQHSDPDRFTPGQADLVRAFANQAAVAIENTRLYEQAQALAAIEERQRLARDLHDAVSQTLFSASLAADVLPRLWEHKPDEARRCLEELGLLTRSALAEMRTLLLELRPAALMEVGLDDLLRQLVEAATGRARVPVALTIDGQCSLPPDVHVTLYRIAQEALSNIVKHAGASQVAVSLQCAPAFPVASDGESTERVELCIQDDGCGFNPATISPDHLGLRIMRERAETIGAAIKIESQVGCGAQLTVVWPSAL